MCMGPRGGDRTGSLYRAGCRTQDGRPCRPCARWRRLNPLARPHGTHRSHRSYGSHRANMSAAAACRHHRSGTALAAAVQAGPAAAGRRFEIAAVCDQIAQASLPRSGAPGLSGPGRPIRIDRAQRHRRGAAARSGLAASVADRAGRHSRQAGVVPAVPGRRWAARRRPGAACPSSECAGLDGRRRRLHAPLLCAWPSSAAMLWDQRGCWSANRPAGSPVFRRAASVPGCCRCSAPRRSR